MPTFLLHFSMLGDEHISLYCILLHLTLCRIQWTLLTVIQHVSERSLIIHIMFVFNKGSVIYVHLRYYTDLPHMRKFLQKDTSVLVTITEFWLDNMCETQHCNHLTFSAGTNGKINKTTVPSTRGPYHPCFHTCTSILTKWIYMVLKLTSSYDLKHMYVLQNKRHKQFVLTLQVI